MSLTFQVIASMSSDQSYVGEIVAFNCKTSARETGREQANRFRDAFERDGNAMVNRVMEVTGATCVEYRVRIK